MTFNSHLNKMFPTTILKQRKVINATKQKSTKEILNNKDLKVRDGIPEESLDVNDLNTTDKNLVDNTLEFDVVERTISRKVMEKYHYEINEIDNQEQKERTMKVSQIMSSQSDYPYSMEPFSMINDRDLIEFDNEGNVLPKPIQSLYKTFKSKLVKGELSQKEIENWEDTFENSNEIGDCEPSTTNIEDDIEIEELIEKVKDKMTLRKRTRSKNGRIRRTIRNSRKGRSINSKFTKNQTNNLEKEIERELEKKEEEIINEKVMQQEKEKDYKEEEHNKRKQDQELRKDNQKTILESIVNLLNNEETPSMALKRFSGPKVKRVSHSRRKFRKKNVQKEQQNPKNIGTVETKKGSVKFNLLSDYIHRAIDFGSYDIYHLTKEQLVDEIRKYKIQTLKQGWLYRWRNDQSDKVYGPYTAEEMNMWLDSGFFYNVFAKRVGDKEFRNIEKIGRFY
ncbi:protein lin1 [Anaeramoeba flamelloides]|uniref:Protein lin1 n=1 Tax=Anaeramoeba flamelloides TaxID=1746091 RepID=A0AAV7YV36_9EUKA|nr:protein lin1 [Anaeramoeba flamelloides]KAJ6238645.1 protein lin1 [Anaeramoeba flamelloides]